MLLLLNNDAAWLKINPEEYKTNRNFKHSVIFADSLKKKILSCTFAKIDEHRIYYFSLNCLDELK